MRLVLAVALLLGGCNYMSETTEVTPIGGDTYSVAGRSGDYAGGQQQGQTLALQKANAYCKAEGQRMRLLAVQPQPGGSTVLFRCTP